MSEVINALNWRYAVKQFNPEKKVSKEDLDTILGAVRLAPSSYGLQPLKILVVENPELRAELRSFSYNQPQVTDASHLLVLCTFNEITEATIEGMIDIHCTWPLTSNMCPSAHRFHPNGRFSITGV